ncbi:MAG: 3'(2'),5'-bisphosphate nucleotidase CysQ [Rhizobiaceae bacterium]
MITLDEMISVSRELCLESGEIAMHHYGNLENVMTKADNSPLTAADLAVDEIIVNGLHRAFPKIPIITEERVVNHTTNHSTGCFFLVDPIDGTKEFINKSNEFTINIALIKNGTPAAGMVYAPALKRLFWGAKDLGAFEETDKGSPKTLAVRDADNDALIVVASRSHMNPKTETFIKKNKVASVKNAGSSLKFCLIAAGEADIYPRFGPTMEWDIAAGHAVLAGAGGVVHTIDGTPISYGQEHYKSPFFIARTASAKYF